MKEGEESEVYIQISLDPGQPEWIKIDNLLEKTFSELLSDQEFINLCLQLKTEPSSDSYKKMGSLILNKSS